MKKCIKLEPDNFQIETTTLWNFPERGNWATHDGFYRGNWSPYIPRNIILRFSKEGDWILDQFVGGGTTLVEAKLLHRNCIGIDINTTALKRCQSKCTFDYITTSQTHIQHGDACCLSNIKNNSIDLICTHPPYANIIQYSNTIKEDLSQYEVIPFLQKINKVASECYRVLKPQKFCAILMGDIRQKGHIIPLGFEVMKIFETQGFKTKEIIIKGQHHCHSTKFWKSKSIRYNFFLIAHEYLFIFRKSMSTPHL